MGNTMKFLKENYKILCALLSALLLLLLVMYLIMALIAYFITWFGSFLILFIAFFLLARKVAAFLVFPGHCSFYKRSVEHRIARQMCTSVINQILEQMYSIDFVCNGALDGNKISNLVETNNGTYNMIISLEYTLGRQKELDTITDDQLSLCEKLEALKDSFRSVQIELSGEQQSLWDLGTFKDAYSTRFNPENFKIIDYNAMRRCSKACSEFCTSFQDLVPYSEVGNPPPMTTTAYLKSFLSNTTFGTIDQLRIELETTYQGVQVTLEGDDNKKIDCMWIPGFTEDENLIGHEDQYLPTMVYCPPNAFLYEFLQTENEWLEFYKNKGINLFVWNYRGFGRSEGFPHPKKLCADGEVIINYLRNQRGIRKMIGVHGQSLGGHIACHLARHSNIDFVFIDRSFSSLEKVSQCIYGNLAKNTLKVITFNSWKCENVENFVFSNVYKVIACDPKDEIIHDMASLKNGITNHVIYQEISRKESRLSIGPERRREARPITFEEYCHIINYEETNGFFTSLKTLYELVLQYASSDTIRSKKNTDGNSRAPVVDLETRPPSESHVGLFGSSDHQNHYENEPVGASGGRVDTQEGIMSDRSNPETEMLSITQETEETFDDTNRLSLSYTFDELETSKVDEERENKKLMRKEKKKQERKFSFKKIDDTSDPTDYDAINRFLLKVHKILDKLDSAGRTLRQIFENSNKVQFDMFRHFIMNLEIFGSFYPLNDRLHDPQVTRISSYLKVSKCRKSLEMLIAEYNDMNGKVFKDVLINAKMASYYFNKIEAFLQRKQNSSRSGKSDHNEKTLFTIDPDIENCKYEEDKVFDQASDYESDNGDGSGYMTPRSDLSVVEDDEDEYHYTKILFKDFAEPDVIKTGYLIPLKCGHNGVYSLKEKSLYEAHMRQAGFLS